MSMDTFDAIHQRRSVKAFDAGAIIRRILNGQRMAAAAAPQCR